MTDFDVYDIDYDLLKKWFYEISVGNLLTDTKNQLLFDYEVADMIKDYIQDGLSESSYRFVDNVQIAHPYIIIQGRLSYDYLVKRLCLPPNAVRDAYDGEKALYIINCDLMHEPDDNQDICTKESFSKEFLQHIYDLGNLDNHEVEIQDDDTDKLSQDISFLLEDYINPDCHIVLATEDRQIAIAFDEYIDNSKEVVGKALNLNPRMFIEVSGFFSTALIIDCEKVYLAKEYYDMDDSEWLY